MKKVKKTILLFSAMILTVVAMASCGGEVANSGSTGDSQSSISNVETSDSAEESSDKDGGITGDSQSSISDTETSDSEDEPFDENGGDWTVIVSGR